MPPAIGQDRIHVQLAICKTRVCMCVCVCLNIQLPESTSYRVCMFARLAWVGIASYDTEVGK